MRQRMLNGIISALVTASMVMGLVPLEAVAGEVGCLGSSQQALGEVAGTAGDDGSPGTASSGTASPTSEAVAGEAATGENWYDTH